jgi:hypothetical protein
MGHHLGETFQEFTGKSGSLKNFDLACQKNRYIVANACQRFQHDLDAGVEAILSCSARQPSSFACTDFDGEVVFLHGKLVEIEAQIPGKWSEDEADLVAHFGKPTSVKTNTAGWDYRSSVLTANETDGVMVVDFKAQELQAYEDAQKSK